ncbi:hypothetical protein CBI38_36280 (plasmid) [Rhodococcus oxybenzonivorans]|uniref:Uncharacterized protein n=1 Tax=Rhodococcus oxybenzonivorans TaxID=1990687 RepID=A0A2S2C7K2_9NOCA|nr:hypothetical protein CBI38_36280 [Rhodococcus oxybenzonivorans]
MVVATPLVATPLGVALFAATPDGSNSARSPPWAADSCPRGLYLSRHPVAVVSRTQHREYAVEKPAKSVRPPVGRRSEDPRSGRPGSGAGAGAGAGALDAHRA